MLTKWEAWLVKVKACGIPQLKNYAKGLEKDRAAVEGAIFSKCSNGQVEGQVNKLKAIKRQMYGRGTFQCLRKRVLLASLGM